MRGRLLAIAALLTALFACPAAAAPTSAFRDWAVVVVAGDWRAHDGGPTEAFDNARRDVAATLLSMGFLPENMTQFSTRPERYPDTAPERLTLTTLTEGLRARAAATRGGCLIYYTSHGAPQGAVMDVGGRMSLVSPTEMATLVDEACPGKPAIVIISACFSGVFVPHLSGPQRMVMTAARPDRSSFGCSSEDKYPYFDACFLDTIGKVKTFPALGPAIQACVTARETAMDMRPPSEPQVAIGGDLRMRLGMMPFATGAAGVHGP